MRKASLLKGATKRSNHNALRYGAKTALFIFALGSSAATAQAQSCETETVCRIGEITQQRLGMVFSAGNPVPGASSTLGLRLRAIPRFSIAVRTTGLDLSIPNFDTPTNTSDEHSNFIRSTNIDAAVGIYGGMSLVPTVGGFGSIDLLASYGKTSLPNDARYAGEDPTSWGAGIRLGILRESFTAPGIGVSAMYRRVGDFRHTIGEPEVDAGTITNYENTSAISLRGTVGKRILVLGATAGIGYDKYATDARIGAPTGVFNTEVKSSTTTLFANLSWTMLILHIVGEGGIQRGDDENAYYGSLAVRVAL